MKKNRFGKKSKPKEDMSLQITSMADIFTILLVFLLKSFSTDVSKIAPHANLQLPEASVTQPIEETLQLEVSSDTILLDEKPVTDLKNFAFNPLDLENDSTCRSLNTALIQQRQKNTLQRYPRLLILADRDAPFSTIRRVLASASNSGFEEFKLVVVEDK